MHRLEAYLHKIPLETVMLTPGNGMSEVITLTSGESNQTIDAGLFRKGSIGDFVWEDLNGDGIRNADELDKGINGVTVKLLADTDNDGQIDDVVQTTVTQTNSNTNLDGFYLFRGLTPGVEYKVMFNNPDPDNFRFTQQYAPTGSLPAQNIFRDSNADPSNGMSEVITLESGESNRTIDAGLFRKAKLGNFVWEDINGDGIQNGNERDNGINGVEVKLLADTDNDGQIDDVVKTTVTQTANFNNLAGFYHFTGLTPGVEYKVMFNNPNPNNFMFTQQYAPTGSLPAQNPVRDSNADPTNGMSEVITLTSGESSQTIAAGLFRKGSIGDFVWEDLNGDGIQNNNELDNGINGVRVKLLADTDNDGQIDDVVQTTVTQTRNNLRGFYQFSGLTPGVEYKVMFNNPNPE